MKDLILASGSPRRKELFDLLEIPYRVEVSNADEVLDYNLPIEKMIENVAYQKGKAVYQNNQNSVVVAADTVVVIDNEILGKPKNKEMCKEMMKKLSGKTHDVITGIAIFVDGKVIQDYEITHVHFVKLTDEEINEYIESSEPYDKAGGYAIQGKAALFIDKIEGNYHNVVGLPIYKVYSYLKELMNDWKCANI